MLSPLLSVDVKGAFDSIPHPKLLEVVTPLFTAESYLKSTYLICNMRTGRWRRASTIVSWYGPAPAFHLPRNATIL